MPTDLIDPSLPAPEARILMPRGHDGGFARMQAAFADILGEIRMD